MVPRRERRPILYFFHGIKSFPFSSLRDINYMDIIIKFLERAALLCSKVIVVPSKTTIPYIQSILPILGKFKQYRIVHNIIPDIFFIQSNKILIKKFKDENGIPYNNKIILYSGRITERKGLLSLLNAFHLLLNITSNVTLIYAYPETSVDQKLLCKLTIRSNELGVAHNLKFFKNLPENKLCFLYKIADITILPSDIEVAPLSMLESLASGSIFLGSDTGNIPDILSRINPLLMLHDTSSQVIYSKLYYFLNVSRQNIKKIQKKSIIIAHKYSSLKSVIELNRIFRRL